MGKIRSADWMVRLGFMLVFAIVWSIANGQQPPWQRIGTGNGLPEASITCIYRTSDGTLYCGTHDGLVAMNGNRFERITTSTDPGSQVNPFIFCITGTRDGVVFAGSRNSIWRYDRKRQKLTTLIHPWALDNGISHLAFNADSSLLMASTSKGVLKVKATGEPFSFIGSIPVAGSNKTFLIDEKWYVYQYRTAISRLNGSSVEPLIENHEILDVLWLNNRRQWLMLTRTGMHLASLNGERLMNPETWIDWKNLPEIPYMYTDRVENVYIKLTEGYVKLDHQTLQEVDLVTSEPENDYTVGNNAAAFFFEDDKGTNWVATTGSGLNYHSRAAGKIRYLSNSSLGCTAVWSFFFDESRSRLWIGTDHGIRIGTFDGSRFTLIRNLVPAQAGNFAVTGMMPLGSANILVCTFGHGCWIADRVSGALKPLAEVNNMLTNRNIYGATPFGDDNILICTQGNAVRWNTRTGTCSPFLPNETNGHFVLAACKDSGGHLWIGDGLGILGAGMDGKFIYRYQNRPGDTTSVSSNVIIAMRTLADGSILLGTMGGGLCRFCPPVRGDRESTLFHRVTLPTNPVNIYGIAEPSPGTIVLTTSNGICRYHCNDGSASIINQQNYLPFSDFNQFACHLSGQYIFTAGEKGVIILPAVELSELFHSNEKIVARRNGFLFNTITQQPGNGILELEAGLLDPLPCKKLVFQYRLNGFEESWHELPTGRDNIVYSFLPPGNYTLCINATDENGVFRADPAEITVSILPQFWQTTLFRVGTTLVILAILVLLVRYISQIRLKWRLKKLEAEQKLAVERARISRELHDNVGSQLTYLISGLENSGFLLEKNQTVRLASDLGTLQRSARETMQQLRQAIWALNQDHITINDLAGRFSLWFNRVTEPHPGIAGSVEVIPGDNPVLDPLKSLNLFRMMQESVNNAIKHAGPCQLSVIIRTLPGKLSVVIADTGNGFTPGKQGGTGMGSLKKRAEEAGIGLKIESAPQTGATITLEITMK